MRNYNRPVVLIEDTVDEALAFASLRAAAHYLYDSDMSPDKPTEISIYTALVYAVKHSNRYKNYTIRFMEEVSSPPSGIRREIEVSYIPEKDRCIVWQLLYSNEDIIQETIVGWYHGRPDEEVTMQFSHLTVMAQYIWD